MPRFRAESLVACLAVACSPAADPEVSASLGAVDSTGVGTSDGPSSATSSASDPTGSDDPDGSSSDGSDDADSGSGDDGGPPPPPDCGDGTCAPLETCSSCADDCGACPTDCGQAEVLCVDDSPGPSAEYSQIQAAVDAAVPGDTVLVFAGDYGGFQIDHSGTEQQRLEIRAAEAGVRVISPADGDGVQSSCADAPSGICIVGSEDLAGIHDVVVEGFEIADMPRSCVVARSANPAVTGDSSPHLRLVLRSIRCTRAGHEGFYLSQVGASLVEGNDIADAGADGEARGHGMYLANAGCDDTIVRGNMIHWDGGLGPEEGAGIHLNGDVTVEGNGGGDGVITGIVIDGNRIWGSAHNGINMDGVRQSRISGNLVWGNARHAITGYAIDAAAGPAELHVVGNTLVVPDFGSGVPIRLHEDEGGHVIFDNVLWVGGGGPSISVDGMAIVSDYNAITGAFEVADEGVDLAQWQAEGLDGHSVVIDDLAALFVGDDDFQLRDGSPGIDAGVDALDGVAAPAIDLEGTPRPTGAGVDLGALER